MAVPFTDTANSADTSSLGASPGNAALTTPVASAAPTPGSPGWSTYWNTKDPQAWSLVWDSQVPKNRTFNENLKSGQPVYFSFDVKDSQAEYKSYLTPMSEEQKANARKALQELSNVTGVKFEEKSGVKGGLVLAQADLSSGTDKYSTMGEHQGAELSVLDAQGKTVKQYQQTIMVNKWQYSKESLAPGTNGFETLLHELGHAAGLDDAKEELGKKYPNLDDTKFTLMSYDDNEDKNRKTFGELDKRAFDILYPREQRPAVTPTIVTQVTKTSLSGAGSVGSGGLEYDGYEWTLEDEDGEDAESATASQQVGAEENREQIVAVETSQDDSKEKQAEFTVSVQHNPSAASWTAWVAAAEPGLLAYVPASSAPVLSVDALTGMLSDQDAWRRMLVQG